MGTTYYYTVNDEIIAEHTLGQSRLDYLTDGIGSIIATIDQTLSVQSTARYKPFGAVLSSTGTQPKFGWVGSLGYRQTGLPHSDVYATRRHLGTTEGRWTTVDPLWPSERAFAYVGANPATDSDPRGTSPRGQSRPKGCPKCNNIWKQFIRSFCGDCRKGKNFERSCISRCDALARAYFESCAYPFGRHREPGFDECYNMIEAMRCPLPTREDRIGPSDAAANWRSSCSSCCGELRRTFPTCQPDDDACTGDCLSGEPPKGLIDTDEAAYHFLSALLREVIQAGLE